MELPEEPVDIKIGLRDALLEGRDWRDGFSDDICIGVWLWSWWRPALEPGGMGREEFVDAVIADRRELWLWLHRRPPVGPVHHRPGRAGSSGGCPCRTVRDGAADRPAEARRRRDVRSGATDPMPRVTVPAEQDPLIYVWTELAPPLTAAAGAYSSAVYEKSSLSLREFEAARITMARINQCAICIDWRTARDVPGRSGGSRRDPRVVLRGGRVRAQLGRPRPSASGWRRVRRALRHRSPGHGRRVLGPAPPSLQRRRAGRPGPVRGVVAGPRPVQPGLRHRRCLPGAGAGPSD